MPTLSADLRPTCRSASKTIRRAILFHTSWSFVAIGELKTKPLGYCSTIGAADNRVVRWETLPCPKQVNQSDNLCQVHNNPYRLSYLQDLENKEDYFQDLQNAGVMVSLELWETQA